MSRIEDYTASSTNYDRTRVPVGVDMLLSLLGGCGAPPNEMWLLDAGCGTGNYIDHLRNHVAHVCGVDGNEGMLAIARQKCADAENVVLKQGLLPKLDFPDRTFDAVIANQVAHHLDPAGDFAELAALMKEAFRVLKTRGVLIFNTCSHEQLKKGYWYFGFIQNAVSKLSQRYVLMAAMEAMLREEGFVDIKRIVPYEAVLQGDSYFDAEGPLKKEWRDGDSTWSLVSPKELAAALERVESMKKDGTLRPFVEEHHKTRIKVGQCVFVSAIKNLSL